MANDVLDTKIVVSLDASPAYKEAPNVSKEISKKIRIKPKTEGMQTMKEELKGLRTELKDYRKEVENAAKVRLSAPTIITNLAKINDAITVANKNIKKYESQVTAARLNKLGPGDKQYDDAATKLANNKQALAELTFQQEQYTKMLEMSRHSAQGFVEAYNLTKADAEVQKLSDTIGKAKSKMDEYTASNIAAKKAARENSKSTKDLTNAQQDLQDKGNKVGDVNAYDKEAQSTKVLADNLKESADNAQELQEKTNKVDVEKVAEGSKKVTTSLEKAMEASKRLNLELKQVDLNADVTKMRPAERDQYATNLKGILNSIRTAGIQGREGIFDKAYDQLVRCNKAARDYNKTLDKISTTTAEVPPLDLKANVAKMNIAELMRYMQRLKDTIKEIEDAGIPVGRADEYQQATVQLIKAQTAVNDYKKQITEASKSNRVFGMQVGTISGAFKNLRSVGVNTLSSIHKSFSRVTNVVSKFKSNVSRGFNNLTRTVHNLRRSMDKLHNSMNRSFKHGFTNLVKYIFGFRSLFFLVRRVRKYIKEGMDNLAHYNDKVNKNVKSHNLFNDAMNELMTSLNYLKNAWGAAFSPLIISVMPALTALIDKLAVAGNYVAYFIATLTGQATAYNALKTAVDDYADSLDKSGSSAKKNSDTQDELNEKLAEYDKLLVIKQDKDKNSTPNSGSGGSNADAVDYSKMFTTIKADDNLAGALKEALEKSDFTTVGNIVRDKIIDALTNIKWKNAKENAKSFGTNLGEFIVGFFEPDENGYSIAREVGKAIGNAFVTGNVFLNALLGELKTHDWGKDIADAIKTFLQTGLVKDPTTGMTGFQLAGDNFKGMVSIIINAFCSAIMNFPTNDFISAITQFLESALSTNNTNAQSLPQKVGTAIGKLLIDGTKVVNAIVTQLGKYKWGSELANGIKAFLEEGLKKDPSGKSGWQLSGETVRGIVTGIVNAICDFVTNFPLSDFKQAVSDWLTGFKPGETIATLTKGVIMIGKGVFDVTKAAVEALADEISDEMVNQTIKVHDVELVDSEGKPVTITLRPTVDFGEHPLLAWMDSTLTDIGEFVVTMVFGIKDMDGTLKMADEFAGIMERIHDLTVTIGLILGSPFAFYDFFKDTNWDAVMDTFLPISSGKKTGGAGGSGEGLGRFKNMTLDLKPANSEIMLIESAWKKVSDAITGPLSIIKEAIYGKDEGTGKNKKHINGLIDYWNELKTTIGAPFSVPLDKIRSALFDEKTGIMQYFVGNGSIIQKIKDKLGLGNNDKIGIVGALKKAFTDPIGTIKTALFDEKTGIMQYFVGNNGIVAKIKQKLGLGSDDKIGIVGALKKAFTNPLGAIKTALFDEKSGIMQYFTGNDSIITKIKKSIEDGGIASAFKKVFSLDSIFKQRTIQSGKLKEENKSLWEKLFGYTSGNKHISGMLDGLADTFITVFENIKKGIKSPIGKIVDMVGGLVNGVIDGINTMCKNLVDVKLPNGQYLYPGRYNPINNWDVKAFKTKYGLAQGAVIPPNKEFLAVLGDQKQGVNIETPLDTMVDAFKQAMAESGGSNHAPIMLQLDGRTVAQVVWNEEEKKYKQTGFGLAY